MQLPLKHILVFTARFVWGQHVSRTSKPPERVIVLIGTINNSISSFHVALWRSSPVPRNSWTHIRLKGSSMLSGLAVMLLTGPFQPEETYSIPSSAVCSLCSAWRLPTLLHNSLCLQNVAIKYGAAISLLQIGDAYPSQVRPPRATSTDWLRAWHLQVSQCICIGCLNLFVATHQNKLQTHLTGRRTVHAHW